MPGWQRCLQLLPTAASFASLWQYGDISGAGPGAPKNVADFCDGLRQAPFGLKSGLIDFWRLPFSLPGGSLCPLPGGSLPARDGGDPGLDRLAPHKYQVKSFSVDGIRLIL